ncbi:hypothetical protein Ef18B233LT_06360 [Escherichia fergusonii]|nr:hypothetical protein Ef18B233LT_06360 [Escherichia fergusonii]BES21291.1 hypothetical protein Ef18B269LT_06350 [Escherichia fergusonii]BES25856.1 hypothetical protein Ef22C021LT_06360 [Escherichia fergusonii]BES30431.1 hypothetical protein Ef22C036LT_06380 [Escherichia fergusonii]BES35010.1 hypothetical protein Ef22C037LT_06380 [Escherichia fergusonii]
MVIEIIAVITGMVVTGVITAGGINTMNGGEIVGIDMHRRRHVITNLISIIMIIAATTGQAEAIVNSPGIALLA